MITFYGDWIKEENVAFKREFRCGRYYKQMFYGPICEFEAKRSGNKFYVVPCYVEFEGPENAIGDYKLLELMSIDLYNEFGPFELKLPRIGRDVKIDSNNPKEISDALKEAISKIKLI